MGKLLISATRVLPFCVVLLVFAAVAPSQPPPPPPPPISHTPGWYSNSEPSIIYENSSGLRIVWWNSYIYRYQGGIGQQFFGHFQG
jgi:hypothetical protein